MAYLIVISSSAYQQPFDFFFRYQYFQVLEEYISYKWWQISPFPAYFTAGWVGGCIYEHLQANNTKLHFARWFLRRFLLLLLLLKGDAAAHTLTLPHSFCHEYRRDVWNHNSHLGTMRKRPRESKRSWLWNYWASEPVSYHELSNTKLFPISWPGQCTCSPQARDSFLPYISMEGSSSSRSQLTQTYSNFR